MCKPKRILYSINDDCIGMQVPGGWSPIPSKPCWKPIPQNRCCELEIDASNSIVIEQKANANVEAKEVRDATISGGTASNTATVEAVQVSVVIVPCCDENNHGPLSIGGYRIGGGGQNLDIQINEDGTATVNGQRINETELEDGTKIMIFRSNQVKENIQKEGK